MDALALKLTVTPALIGGATLIGRRYGPAVSGWLVGIPFTSAPVLFFTALAHGNAFAAQVGLGILLGTISQTACALAYGYAAAGTGRNTWPCAWLSGTLAFAACTLAMHPWRIDVLPAFFLAAACAAIGLALMPKQRAAVPQTTSATAWWDLPFRMAVATALVITLTEIANVAGARWTGLLSPYPLYGLILTIFAHRETGGATAVEVMRGLVIGLFGFAAFFAVIALWIEPLGLYLALGCALLATLLIQMSALIAMRKGSPFPRGTARR